MTRQSCKEGQVTQEWCKCVVAFESVSSVNSPTTLSLFLIPASSFPSTPFQSLRHREPQKFQHLRHIIRLMLMPPFERLIDQPTPVWIEPLFRPCCCLRL